MNASSRRLLRWYPAAWRERYGEEFAALLDDTVGEAAPSVSLRLHVIRSGVAMRLRETGVIGDGTPPVERIRAGALLVLWAWSIFVLAGMGLQKLSEHWDAFVSSSAHTHAGIAFGTVQVLAGVASLFVLVGAIAVLPATVRFLASGGWDSIRRSVVRAVVTCGVTAIAFVTLVSWAHRLSPAQRNGGDIAYGLGALGGVLLVAASLATVTAAAVGIVRELHLSPRTLRLEGYLAEAVTGAMAFMAAAAFVWWGVMVETTPWFFGGTAQRHGSGLDLSMVLVAGLMLCAVILALLGSRRVHQGIHLSS